MGANAAEYLRLLGGEATWAQLAEHVTQHELRRGLASGEVIRTVRGRYALPTLSEPLRLARSCGGALSHASAARHHGLSLVDEPSVVQVLIPPGRAEPGVPGTVVRRARLADSDRQDGVTGFARTVLDCATTMPLPEALAVADSALRRDLVSQEKLVGCAAGRRGHGSAAARRVMSLADERSANAFESALRGHLVVAGLTTFVPQHIVTGPGVFAQVDLADPLREVALETDGYAIHGDRRRFARDLRRHDELATLGWLTLRFAWEHVMFEPDWVVSQVRLAVRSRRRRRPSPPGIRRASSEGTRAS